MTTALTDLADLTGPALRTALFAAAAGAGDDRSDRIRQLAEHGGVSRLGFVHPPTTAQLIGAADAVLAGFTRSGPELTVVGTGGWAFAARAIAEVTGTADRLSVLDQPDAATVAAVAGRPVLSISASGTTFETDRLTHALAGTGAEVHRLGGTRLSARGQLEHTAMFGAPLTVAFAAPARWAAPAGALAAYQALAADHQALADDALSAAVRCTGSVGWAAPRWAGPGLRGWLDQLLHQVLGGKGAPLRLAGPVILDYRDTEASLTGLVALCYHAGLFAAGLGLRHRLPICTETNVHVYKDILPSVTGCTEPAGVRVPPSALPTAITGWAGPEPVDVVNYGRAPVTEALVAAGRTRPGWRVAEGPRWNHTRFQSAWPAGRVAVVIDQVPADPLAHDRQRLGIATQLALAGRSELFVVTNREPSPGDNHEAVG